ncbi:PAS domain-containing sensor histidine kinase [Lysinibacillus sp. 2017]|uniref:two-component system histidine kinase PnpS n=1 Tax=unclassified Lysinibacillus TaxID=2636778 RepID=UPI000D528E4F|nr:MULTISPECIES: HAMP domain-containing sensor histidine kinase [unclassified Lysinibacillus]AWE08312.1 PAS domain-containing sensor histidine kinase [Lysinibacillus sp. 2017]TGN35839.1 sensor histidine kinase [Lysinibacillus sp. S2017]
MNNRLFYSFIFVIVSILAVLGLFVGQLFPFFANDYIQSTIIENQQKMEQVVQEEKIQLSSAQKRALLETYEIDKNATTYNEVRMHLYTILVLLIVVACIIMAFMIHRMASNFITPIDNITRTAMELSKGNYRARAFAKGPKTVVELRNSINILARNLQDITKTRVIEEERLKTLIENMGSALMMLDREGNISIVNRKFQVLFDLEKEQLIGKNFLTLGLTKQLEQFIDYVFLTEMPYRQQLEMEIGDELYNEQIYGAPVVGEHGRWLGVVIVMHDVSELIRLEQIRKDFVANVSHELRTPITSIKGFSETLLDGAFKDENMLLSFLNIIHEESNRIQVLVQDLLELSKIERHGFLLDVEPVKLQDILIRVVDLTSAQLESKNMQFEVNIEQDAFILGDVNRLMQIFTNLINNAMAYSKEHTTVTLRISSDEQYGIFEITDQGIGIEKSEIPRVFERFYRIDRARSRNSGGTGLGLSIVKHLVEAHQGKIQVSSEVGKGTTMKVYLPLQ